MSQGEKVIGHRDILLAYLMCKDEVPAIPVPDPIADKAYNVEHSLVNAELIDWATFDHALYV